MRTLQTSAAISGVDEFVRADLVSGQYFSVLGLVPAAGRLLTSADDAQTALSPGAVISDRYWQRRFGRSPSAIGTTVAVRDRVFTIVGVMPPTFQSAMLGSTPDIVFPLSPMLSENERSEPTSNFLKMIGRLKPGATVQQADAEARQLFRGWIEPIAAAVPAARRNGLLGQQAGAVPAPDGSNPFRADLAVPLMIVMGIVGFILLLACVNVSGLLLARAAARAREVSIRLAIGAGRGRLVRQFLTESLVLVCLGGGLGVVLAGTLSTALVAMFTSGRDVELSVAPDWRVAIFTAAVAAAATLLAGLLPAIHAIRRGLAPALKQVRAQGHTRTGNALVVAQFAIAMVLTVGATLFVGTLISLYRVDRGFESAGLTVAYARSTRTYTEQEAVHVSDAVLESLRRMPRADAVAAASVLPIDGNLWVPAIEIQGDSLHPGEADAAFNVVSPGYFSTLRTPLLSGREFDAHDRIGTPRVAVVNAAFVRYFFGDGAAIGRRVTYRNQIYDIVGVVGDVKYEDLRAASPRTMYVTTGQREFDNQPSDYKYIVRTAGSDPRQLDAAIADALRTADPALHLRTTMSYADVIGRTLPAERILATLGGVLGVVAVLVAGIGLFGVLAFQVARRTNELGVRLVLGASPRSMMGLVVRDMAWLLVPGLVVGAGGAALLTGIARGLLFGLTPTDPRAFAASAGVLTMAAVGAAWLPARRAARIDPLVALRQE
jgi:predicted permease